MWLLNLRKVWNKTGWCMFLPKKQWLKKYQLPFSMPGLWNFGAISNPSSYARPLPSAWATLPSFGSPWATLHLAPTPRAALGCLPFSGWSGLLKTICTTFQTVKGVSFYLLCLYRVWFVLCDKRIHKCWCLFMVLLAPLHQEILFTSKQNSCTG